MSNLIVCRICLADNIRLNQISNTPQQEIFEKFTGAKLITEDGRPDTLCYLCNSELRRFSRFFDMHQQAEEYLRTLLRNGSPEVIPLQKSLHNLTQSPLQNISLIDPSTLRDKDIVKIEPKEPDTSDEEMHDDTGDLIIDTDITDNDLIDMIDTKDIVHEQIAENRELMNGENADNEESVDSKEFITIEITAEELPTRGINNGVYADNGKSSAEEIAENGNITNGVIADSIKTTNGLVADNREINEVTIDSEDIAGSKEIIDAVTITDSEDEFSCDQCEKKFNFVHQLNFHKRLHKSKSLKCNICIKRFSTTTSLSVHLAKIHNKISMNDRKTTVKNKKDKSVVTKNNINVVKSKDIGKVYECTRCIMNFANETDLVKHAICHATPQVVITKVAIPDLTETKKIDLQSENVNTRSSPRLAKCRKY